MMARLPQFIPSQCVCVGFQHQMWNWWLLLLSLMGCSSDWNKECKERRQGVLGQAQQQRPAPRYTRPDGFRHLPHSERSQECPTTITQIPFKMSCTTYKFYRNVNIPMFSVYTGRDTVLRVHAVNDVVSELLGNSIQLLNLFIFYI